MKKSFIILTITLTAGLSCFADGTYNITSNTSWSTQNYSVNDGKPSSFIISSGKTLTINESNVSCYDCSFSGGSIVITTSFTCQSCSFTSTTISMSNATLNLQTSLSSFSSVTITVSGTGEINDTAAMSISNSTFTFNNSAELYNNGGPPTITASTLNYN